MRNEAIQALIQSGAATAEEVRNAAEESRKSRASLLLALLKARSADSCMEIASTLARHYKIPFISLDKVTPDQKALQHCKPEQARRLHFLPITESDDKVVVGMVDPLDLGLLDEIRAIYRKKVEPVFIGKADFERNFHRFYRQGVRRPEENDRLLDTMLPKSDASGPTPEGDSQAEHAAKFASLILAKAFAYAASDIVIVPQPEMSLVNLRVDGAEYPLFRLSPASHRPIVEALMRHARLQPDDLDVDLFSRSKLKYRDRKFILTYSFRNTPAGIHVRIHIIDPAAAHLGLESLGLNSGALKRLKESLDGTGLIVVTGPEGSGKSTALLTLAKQAADTGRNVYTIEDIVGQKVEGVSHLRAKPHGPSKAAILKALVAKQADVIVIDEMEYGMMPTVLDAAQSCLILLAVPAAGIGEALSRLLRADIPRLELAARLKALFTHRFTRTLCTACKSTATIHPETVAQFHIPESTTFWSGKGCDACNNTGYKGVISIAELLPVDPAVSEAIRQGAAGPEIFREGRYQGMMTLFETGANRAMDGATSLEEVIATLPFPDSFNMQQRMRMGRIAPLKRPEDVPPDSRQAGAHSGEQAFLSLFESEREEEKPAIAAADAEAKAAPSTPPAAETSPVAEAMPEPPRVEPPPADTGLARILLVDDSPTMLEYTRHILGASGYFEIDTAATAEQGREMLLSKQYHLVITDHEMPGETGQELIDFIRSHPSLNNVGTILLTGNVNEMAALAGGADGYIGKPTDPEILVARAKSISDIYKRIARSTAAAAAQAVSPRTTEKPQAKIDFTEKDLSNIGRFELDIPGAAAQGTDTADSGLPTDEPEQPENDDIFS